MSVDVSVIIASYNVEHYIARAITSALKQEGVALEVIVVDDASTDATWAVINGMRDPRLKHLRLERNAGPSAARNVGLAQATGTWVAILDGDDVLLPGRLARLVAAGQNAHILVDNLQVQREDDGTAFPMFSPEAFAALPEIDLARFITGTFPNAASYTLGYLKPLFRNSFLRQYGLQYEEELRIGEDYLLFAEALAHGARCRVIAEMGYGYTARKGSISHRLSSRDVKKMLEGDKNFTRRHPLQGAAAEAQTKRSNDLQREYGFALLVEAIKTRKPTSILRLLLTHPSSFWLLHRPVLARLRARSTHT
jgi:succinoglycan biosynthesis protein ExoO